MRNFFIVCLGITLYSSVIFGQSKDITAQDNWKFNLEGDFYFTDPFFVLPLITADKDWVHLEARYNYEELKTFSGWLGYNFSGGNKFEYNITPMAGFMLGQNNRICARTGTWI